MKFRTAAAVLAGLALVAPSAAQAKAAHHAKAKHRMHRKLAHKSDGDAVLHWVVKDDYATLGSWTEEMYFHLHNGTIDKSYEKHVDGPYAGGEVVSTMPNGWDGNLDDDTTYDRAPGGGPIRTTPGTRAGWPELGKVVAEALAPTHPNATQTTFDGQNALQVVLRPATTNDTPSTVALTLYIDPATNTPLAAVWDGQRTARTVTFEMLADDPSLVDFK